MYTSDVVQGGCSVAVPGHSLSAINTHCVGCYLSYLVSCANSETAVAL
jgi:hypothetical protein